MDSNKRAGEGRTWTKQEALEVIQEFRDMVRSIPSIKQDPAKVSAAVDRLGELRSIITEMQSQGVN